MKVETFPLLWRPSSADPEGGVVVVGADVAGNTVPRRMELFHLLEIIHFHRCGKSALNFQVGLLHNLPSLFNIRTRAVSVACFRRSSKSQTCIE